MLRKSMLASTNFANYVWPEDEFARFNAYLASTTPLWTPTNLLDGAGNGVKKSPSGPPNFQDDAKAVVRLGPIVASFLRIGVAIRDPRCHKRHLRVLCSVMECLNRKTGTAFPDRRTIAENEGLEVHTVENVLYELRKWGHIDWEKRTDPQHRGRLLHYTLPVTRWTEERINQTIHAPRGDGTRSDGHSKCPSQQVQEVPVPTGIAGQSTPPNGKESTPPGVSSNLSKEPEDKTTSRRRATPRTRLPIDWLPTAEDRAWTVANFIATDQQVAIEASKFRDHHHSKGSTMADWGAAWRSWWGKDFHNIPRRPPANDSVRPTGLALAPYWWKDNPHAARAIGGAAWRLQVKSRPSGAWPVAMLGPPPGSENCLVPPEVVREFRLAELYTPEGSPR